MGRVSPRCAPFGPCRGGVVINTSPSNPLAVLFSTTTNAAHAARGALCLQQRHSVAIGALIERRRCITQLQQGSHCVCVCVTHASAGFAGNHTAPGAVHSSAGDPGVAQQLQQHAVLSAACHDHRQLDEFAHISGSCVASCTTWQTLHCQPQPCLWPLPRASCRRSIDRTGSRSSSSSRCCQGACTLAWHWTPCWWATGAA